MIVGVLKEIKAEENRISMTPAGAEVMKQNGQRKKENTEKSLIDL